MRIIHSGDEPGLFRTLHGLRPPPRGQLGEQPGRVRLDRVLAHEQVLRHLAIAQPRGNGLENLQLAWRDAELLEAHLIALEWPGDWHRHFPHDHHLTPSREGEAEPDPEGGENQRNDPAVDLERMLQDEKAILDDLERGDQRAAEYTVD